MTTTIKTIKSVSEFINTVLELTIENNTSIFYRGHANYDYDNTPHVFRKPGFIENEHKMIRELIAYHPEEFRNDHTALEQLVRAQHYGLPTRLLDLTRNPLISLYFACEKPRGGPRTDGAVVVFETSEKRVKSFESDTVSCIANLCFLSKANKDEISQFLRNRIKGKKVNDCEIREFNKLDSAKNLRNLILSEKPYFGHE